MKAHIASLINAITLMGLGYWGFHVSTGESNTPLIPIIAGVLLLAMNKGVKAENKVIAHIAVLITFLMIPGLGMALKGRLAAGDSMAVTRVAIMLATTVLAMVFFIKSFIDARKNREKQA